MLSRKRVMEALSSSSCPAKAMERISPRVMMRSSRGSVTMMEAGALMRTFPSAVTVTAVLFETTEAARP